MRKVKVEYTGGLDTNLDKKITKFFGGLGFEWTGQGMELAPQIRDITFELESKKMCKEKGCKNPAYKKGWCRGHLGIKIAEYVTKN